MIRLGLRNKRKKERKKERTLSQHTCDHSQGVYCPPNTGGGEQFFWVYWNKQTNKQTNKQNTLSIILLSRSLSDLNALVDSHRTSNSVSDSHIFSKSGVARFNLINKSVILFETAVFGKPQILYALLY